MVDLDILLSKLQYMSLVFHGRNGEVMFGAVWIQQLVSVETELVSVETQCGAGICSAFVLSEQLLELLRNLFA